MLEEPLEARVARLEQQMHLLLRGQTDDSEPAPDDWQQTVGMLRGDPIVQEMIDQSRRMREEERRRAHETMEPDSA